MNLPEEIGYYGWPDRDTWLESLEPGTDIMIENRIGDGSSLHKTTVKAITPQGKIRLENGDLYPSWGSMVLGGRWSRHLRPVTDPEHDELERQAFLTLIRETDFEKLGLERLRKIVELLKGEEA